MLFRHVWRHYYIQLLRSFPCLAFPCTEIITLKHFPAAQPLCDELKTESDASGHKAEGILKRIRDYEAKLDSNTKAALKVWVYESVE